MVYIVWALTLPLGLWAVGAAAHYFKTFKALAWFSQPDQHERRGPMFVRVLDVLALVIIGVQIHA